MNVGKIIETSILNYYRKNYRGLIPHPATNTRMCILGGVKGTYEEEERCPRTSPLTLTSITKHPVDKRKKNMQEIEEEEDIDGRENEQAIVVRSAKEREERQRNMTLIWNLSPDAREYHQEPAGSSWQQSNNEDIMDMLLRMEQRMKERDDQMKLQPQLKDEYMDVELKRRDQYLEEVIR